MPRTEQLSNLTPNRIYAIDGHLKYAHHRERVTTAIIDDGNVQARVRIPRSLEDVRQEIEEGAKYHFGYCYINKNKEVVVRNPDSTIVKAGDPAHVQTQALGDIASSLETCNGKYLTTLLYVVKFNAEETVVKNGQNLQLCILNCYANGLLVDVVFWNSDLPIAELEGKWVVFSGFRIKKLIDWKFVLVSSVYSKISAFEGQIRGIPYVNQENYCNLSSIYEPRTIAQVMTVAQASEKTFSLVEAEPKMQENYTYEGCSVCRRKLSEQENCYCYNSQKKEYTFLKLTLVDRDNTELPAGIFDEQVKKQLMEIKEPRLCRFHIKSVQKYGQSGEKLVYHTIAKIIQ